MLWFNPDLDGFEKGTEDEYMLISKNSHNSHRFEILHEFDPGVSSESLAIKVLLKLNLARHLGSQVKFLA
jgi:hypothetical protein